MRWRDEAASNFSSWLKPRRDKPLNFLRNEVGAFSWRKWKSLIIYGAIGFVKLSKYARRLWKKRLANLLREHWGDFYSFVQQREDDVFTLNIYYAFAKKSENPRGGNFCWRRRRGRWHGSASIATHVVMTFNKSCCFHLHVTQCAASISKAFRIFIPKSKGKFSHIFLCQAHEVLVQWKEIVSTVDEATDFKHHYSTVPWYTFDSIQQRLQQIASNEWWWCEMLPDADESGFHVLSPQEGERESFWM